MRKNDQLKFLLLSILVFAIIALVFSLFNVIENEGFNPSDDGVILAQSYRLLHHEVPHKDFISIRPAGSGYLHTLDGSVPLPLEISARWATLVEYFVYSTLWLLLLFNVIRIRLNGATSYILTACTIILAFIITLNTKHIFPWTTVDSLLFASAGCLFIMKSLQAEQLSVSKYSQAAIALFFLGLSTLCRQTFLLPFLIFAVLVLFSGVRQGNYLKAIIALVAGSFPLLFYCVYLYYKGAFPDLINQLSGRTELYQTGIYQFAKQFIYTPWAILNFGYLLIVSGLFWRNKLLSPRFISQTDGFIFILVILLSAIQFFGHYQTAIPFELFWTCLFLTARIFLIQKKSEILSVSVIILILSWTSSISLGDNSPMFCNGMLSATIVCQLYFINQDFCRSFLQKNKKITILITSLFTILLFCISIRGQALFNYRDLPSDRLTTTLQDIIPEMGGIKVNPVTRAYYDDFFRIKNDLEIPDGQLVVLPNNAIIYPLLKSRDPFPIDWAQQNEYVGAGEKMHSGIIAALAADTLYIFIDKIDSKYMFDGTEPFEPDLDFNHEYLPLITQNCKHLPIQSDFFDVYFSK